jgi:type VI secretion system FHA domain protein
MIVLTVQSFNGQPSAGPSASFDELGGTIGRADNNQLVLPDPDRSISRVHAQVVFRNGGYAIVDRGSNAVLVNGQPLGNGREALIRDGDVLKVGGYAIGVAFGHKTVAAKDPFADLFGGDAAPPIARPAPLPASPAPRVPPPAAAAWPPAGPIAAPGPSAIPEDWDPFAPSPAPAAAGGGFDFDFAAPAAASGNPYIPDLPVAAPSRGDSLDALFDLGGGSTADPFANTPSAAPLSQPNTFGDEDPLRAFGILPPASPPPASDHVSDLNTPWAAKPLREAPAPAAAPVRAPSPPHLPASPLGGQPAPAPPPGAILSWDQPSRDVKVVTLPGVRRSPAPPPTPIAEQEPDPLTQIIPSKPRPAPAAPTAAAADNHGALLAAFAEGLGVPGLKLDRLDATQMRLIGRLLREATQGSVELLAARAAVKREMRADVTMIVARQNNPLKFSPSVEVALQHLLGTPTPGFMAPADAMRDAFDDLRAHQLGVMAGMRSALEGVLQRFDPAVLEGKIAKRSGLANLMSNRKAQLWEQFQQLYTQLSAEAADDFQELFGKAFRRAYEAHIDELQRSNSNQ